MAHIKVINVDAELRKAFHTTCVKRGVSMSKRLIELMETEVAKMRWKESIGRTALTPNEIERLVSIAEGAPSPAEIESLAANILTRDEISEIAAGIVGKKTPSAESEE